MDTRRFGFSFARGAKGARKILKLGISHTIPKTTPGLGRENGMQLINILNNRKLHTKRHFAPLNFKVYSQKGGVGGFLVCRILTGPWFAISVYLTPFPICCCCIGLVINTVQGKWLLLLFRC